MHARFPRFWDYALAMLVAGACFVPRPDRRRTGAGCAGSRRQHGHGGLGLAPRECSSFVHDEKETSHLEDMMRKTAYLLGVLALILIPAATAHAGTTVPEVDASTVSAGLGLLTAGVLIVRSRRRR
jgi:hypothetical protein